MAAAYGVTVAELHPQDGRPGMPAEVLANVVARARGGSLSAAQVREWPESDLEIEMLLATAEAARQRKQQREARSG